MRPTRNAHPPRHQAWVDEVDALLAKRRGGRPKYDRRLAKKRYRPRPRLEEARLLIANALAANLTAELESLMTPENAGEEMIALHRYRQHPRDRTITRRRQLAQSMRSELQNYRYNAGTHGDDATDAMLARVARSLAELLDLEGLHAVDHDIGPTATQRLRHQLSGVSGV